MRILSFDKSSAIFYNFKVRQEVSNTQDGVHGAAVALAISPSHVEEFPGAGMFPRCPRILVTFC